MSNISFAGVGIGQHGWLKVNTANEVEVHKIPRADGSIIRRRGGGLKTLTVTAWIKTDNRFEIEEYFNDLAGNLTSAVADLIVNGETYSNCILQNVSPASTHLNAMSFTVTFLKSGD